MDFLFDPSYTDNFHSIVFRCLNWPVFLANIIYGKIQLIFFKFLGLVCNSSLAKNLKQLFSNYYKFFESVIIENCSLESFLKFYLGLSLFIFTAMYFIVYISRKLYQPARMELIIQLDGVIKILLFTTFSKIIFFAWLAVFMERNYNISLLKMAFSKIDYFWTALMIFDLFTYSIFQITVYLGRLGRKEKRLVRIRHCYPSIPVIAFMASFCTLSIIQSLLGVELQFFYHQIPILVFSTLYSINISDAFICLFDDIYIIIFESSKLYDKYYGDD